MSYKINDTVVVDDSRNVCACCVTSCCITASDQMVIPSGDTASRPTGATGSLYFDTDEGALVAYDGTAWAKQGGSGFEATQLTGYGDFLGPMREQCNCCTGPKNAYFHPGTEKLLLLDEVCSSCVRGRSFSWDSGTCSWSAVRPTNCSTALCGACAIANGLQSQTIVSCLAGTPTYAGAQFSNCQVSFCCNGIACQSGGFCYFCTCDCGLNCCFVQRSGYTPNSAYVSYDGCYLIHVPDKIACYRCTDMCGCTAGQGVVLICQSGNCLCTQCVRLAHVRCSDTCCVPFYGSCFSKTKCESSAAALPNGLLLTVTEEVCGSCSTCYHVLLVCHDGRTHCLGHGCFCHCPMQQVNDNIQTYKVGTNFVVAFPYCCSTCCDKTAIFAVEGTGTEDCLCVAPGASVRFCALITDKCEVPITGRQYLNSSNATHPHKASSYKFINAPSFKCFQACCSPCHVGWAGTGTNYPYFSIDTQQGVPEAESAGSSRKIAQPDPDVASYSFVTDYIPSGYETWGCAFSKTCHPTNVCEQNLMFFCWGFGSGSAGGVTNTYHIGIFISCNCLCSCCKQRTYYRLYC